jgi:hypothetical protein
LRLEYTSKLNLEPRARSWRNSGTGTQHQTFTIYISNLNTFVRVDHEDDGFLSLSPAVGRPHVQRSPSYVGGKLDFHWLVLLVFPHFYGHCPETNDGILFQRFFFSSDEIIFPFRNPENPKRGEAEWDRRETKLRSIHPQPPPHKLLHNSKHSLPHNSLRGKEQHLRMDIRKIWNVEHPSSQTRPSSSHKIRSYYLSRNPQSP